MRSLTSPSDLDAVCALPQALVFKHSTRCPVSSLALAEVEAFSERRPEVPVVIVDVIAARDVARAATARFGIPHASPQAILVVGGEPAWNASHFAVTATTLASAVQDAERGAADGGAGDPIDPAA